MKRFFILSFTLICCLFFLQCEKEDLTADNTTANTEAQISTRAKDTCKGKKFTNHEPGSITVTIKVCVLGENQTPEAAEKLVTPSMITNAVAKAKLVAQVLNCEGGNCKNQAKSCQIHNLVVTVTKKNIVLQSCNPTEEICTSEEGEVGFYWECKYTISNFITSASCKCKD